MPSKAGRVGYRTEEQKSSRWSWARVGGILIALIVAGVAKVATRNGIDFIQRKSASTSQVENAFETNEKFGSAFVELKTDFPDDYHRMTTNLASLIRTGATEEQLKQSGFDTMQRFTFGHMSQIASASDETLLSIARAQAAVASSLSAEDQSACAAFGFDGLRPNMQLSPSTLEQITKGTTLMIRAAHEGTTNPHPRNTATLSDTDSKAFVSGMERAGVTRDQFAVFDSDAAMQRASAPDKCHLTVAMYDSMAAMPPSQSARVTAYILMQAAAARQQPTS
jgi:hypothetical protein